VNILDLLPLISLMAVPISFLVYRSSSKKDQESFIKKQKVVLKKITKLIYSLSLNYDTNLNIKDKIVLELEFSLEYSEVHKKHI